MCSISVTTLALHNILTSLSISATLPLDDYEIEKDRVIERTMKLMGFESRKEYKEAYPGNYSFGSALETVLKFDKRDYSSYDTDLMCFGRILSVVLDIDPVKVSFDTCSKYVIKSAERSGGNCCLPMVLFPEIEDFDKSISSAHDLEDFHKQLWFCEDWSEM